MQWVPESHHEAILYLGEFCTVSYQIKNDYQVFAVGFRA